MKNFYAYIRVSTVKQGEHGSSLQEQRYAIDAFAARQQLSISRYFEETETAAKLGRREFNRMVGALERGRADGVIIHKIDRSARNLKDWARLGDLMDKGVEVHFAHDSMDLTTRGGRLAADLQAVIAADYVRNLRDEVRKGFYGRLKQGLYPLPAPRGYLDRGRGKPKEIDPANGPLVRRAFELYATGSYSLETLRLKMIDEGLCAQPGKALSTSSMSQLLRNPFYMGMIRIKRTNETFEGAHEALVAKSVFDRVQTILTDKLYPRIEIHNFLFRRMIICDRCGRSLTGERQKGHIYYRCHDRGCRGVSIAEERVEDLVKAQLALIRVDDRDMGDFREVIADGIACEAASTIERAEHLNRDRALVEQKIARLTDAVLDGTIDKPTYDARKAALIAQKLDLAERQKGDELTIWEIISERFELGILALPQYETGTAEEKRALLKSIGSNLLAQQKEPVFPMFFPLEDIRNWVFSNRGGPHQGAVRIPARALLRQIVRNYDTQP